MEYKNYTVEDYLSDENFQNWIKSGRKNDFIETYGLETDSAKRVIHEAANIIEVMTPEKQVVNQDTIEKGWDHLQQNIVMQDDSRVGDPMPETRVAKSTWLKYAAAAVLLAFSVLMYFNQPSNEIPMTVHRTAFGEKTSVTLSDGTSITLNSNSTISIDEQAGGPPEVWLDGEAFFQVAKQKEGQFVVHTGDLDIKVLGTQFNIINHGQEIRVALKEGSILLKGPTVDGYSMKPGQTIIFEPETKGLIEDPKNDSYYYAWLNNQMVLDETSIAEIANIIENNFGVQVSIMNDQLRDRKLTGTIPDDDLNTLLAAIRSTVDAEVSHNGSEIKIY